MRVRPWLRLQTAGAQGGSIPAGQQGPSYVHRDALELLDGEIVLVTKLAGGQHATVLQLPASPCEIMPEKEAQKPAKLPSFEEANR